MKTVFNNSMVAHIWAQQNQDNGRSSNGQLFFKEKTIYSYNIGWPLASFIKADLVFLNDTNYSVTTSKHLAYVRQALRGGLNIRAMSKRALYEYINNFSSEYAPFLNALAKDCQNLFDKNMRSAASRRKAELKGRDISEIRHFLEYTLETINLLELSCPKSIMELIGRINSGNYDDVLGVFKIELQKENEAKLARKKEYEAKQAEILKSAIELWQVHKQSLLYSEAQAMRNTDKIFMRVNGDKIETSKGASFPIDHAIKAFKIVRLFKEKQVSNLNFQKCINGKTIHLGHFQIDDVDTDGNVKAGCHYVEWSQIEYCARELNIYP